MTADIVNFVFHFLLLLREIVYVIMVYNYVGYCIKTVTFIIYFLSKECMAQSFTNADMLYDAQMHATGSLNFIMP
jgi:hypothetical protein